MTLACSIYKKSLNVVLRSQIESPPFYCSRQPYTGCHFGLTEAEAKCFWFFFREFLIVPIKLAFSVFTKGTSDGLPRLLSPWSSSPCFLPQKPHLVNLPVWPLRPIWLWCPRPRLFSPSLRNSFSPIFVILETSDKTE